MGAPGRGRAASVINPSRGPGLRPPCKDAFLEGAGDPGQRDRCRMAPPGTHWLVARRRRGHLLAPGAGVHWRG